jgi:hypothetical protein
MKKLIASVVLTGALVAGGTGAALAADSGSSTTTPSTEASQAHPRLAHLRRAAFRVVVDTLKVQPSELRDALRGGQTIAQFAQSKGVDPQTVVNALVTAGTTKADQALQAGNITQAQHDKIVAKLPDAASRFVNRQWPPRTTAGNGSPTQS